MTRRRGDAATRRRKPTRRPISGERKGAAGIVGEGLVCSRRRVPVSPRPRVSPSPCPRVSARCNQAQSRQVPVSWSAGNRTAPPAGIMLENRVGCNISAMLSSPHTRRGPDRLV